MELKAKDVFGDRYLGDDRVQVGPIEIVVRDIHIDERAVHEYKARCRDYKSFEDVTKELCGKFKRSASRMADPPSWAKGAPRNALGFLVLDDAICFPIVRRASGDAAVILRCIFRDYDEELAALDAESELWNERASI